MPKDQRKRQQIRQRNAARRKQKQHSAGAPALAAPRAVLRAAAHWPLEECLVSEGWDQQGALVQILVARRSPVDQIAAAVFLIDSSCLGVKNADVKLFDSPLDYRNGMRARIAALQGLLPVDLDLATKIIRDSIAYARALGFHPHRDYQAAAPFLEGGDADRSAVPVPVGGPDGKPLFISGPYDDVPSILAQLERAVGPGQFNYTIRVDPHSLVPVLDVEDDDAGGADSPEEGAQQEQTGLLRRLGLPFGR
jgi:hypothetical protein